MIPPLGHAAKCFENLLLNLKPTIALEWFCNVSVAVTTSSKGPEEGREVGREGVGRVGGWEGGRDWYIWCEGCEDNICILAIWQRHQKKMTVPLNVSSSGVSLSI